MIDYKMEAAKAALKLIAPKQVIGLGAGTTIAHLVNILAEDDKLSASVAFTSSSFKTTHLLNSHGLHVKSPASLKSIDIYFDGCDQFDTELNALKSGGGIHTTEKILASMAKDFILIGDATKFADKLGTTYPIVIEVLPAALQLVVHRIITEFANATINLRMSTQKDGAVISDNGNMLIDVYLTQLDDLHELNICLKMITGVVEHSLFYRMATRAIIAGKGGTEIITAKH